MEIGEGQVVSNNQAKKSKCNYRKPLAKDQSSISLNPTTQKILYPIPHSQRPTATDRQHNPNVGGSIVSRSADCARIHRPIHLIASLERLEEDTKKDYATEVK